MLSELLGELIATGLALLGSIVVAIAWRLLLRVPFVMIAIGAALLAAGVALAIALGGMNLRTEGSPAGTGIFVILGSAVLACGALGLVFTVRGFIAAASRSPLHVLAGVVLMAGVALGMFRYGATELGTGGTRGPSGPETVVEAPIRTYPPITERGGARLVELRDVYAFSWKARGAAPAMQMAVPVAQFAYPATRISETVDGPRHVDLLVAEVPPAFARIRLYRDDSELDEPVHSSLYGRLLKPADWQGILRADETPRAWRLAGLDCDAPAFAKRAGAVRSAPPGCYEPRGFFDRWFASGSKRLRLDVRAVNAGCGFTFPYRGRPVTVTTREACSDPAAFAGLAAATRLLSRLENAVHAPPAAEERLARARDAVTVCEEARGPEARVERCRLAIALAQAEREMSLGAADTLLARASEAAAASRR